METKRNIQNCVCRSALLIFGSGQNAQGAKPVKNFQTEKYLGKCMNCPFWISNTNAFG
jgi:lipocalin